MDPFIIGIIGVIVFFVLLFLGVHVAIALGVVGSIGLWITIGFDPALRLISSTIYNFGISYSMSVLPLFIAMGLFALEIGAARDAFDALAIWLGKVRGSLGLSTIGGSTIFGAITGSSIATAVVFAKTCVPEMVKYGYDKNTSYGLVAAAGGIGMLIPPSTLAIIYATVTERSLGIQLAAGIGPGIVFALTLGAGFFLLATMKPSMAPQIEYTSISTREKLSYLIKLWPFVLVFVIVIGGIYSGYFTIIEASGIGNLILFVLFLYKFGINANAWEKLKNVFSETAVLSAVIFSVFCFAQVFTRFLVMTGITDAFVNFIVGLDLSPLGFVIAAAILYMFLGCFIDAISIIMITLPMFIPVLEHLGIDFYWFGVILILATQLGLITPPVGINLYAVKGVAGSDTDLSGIIQGAFPFLIFGLVALIIVIAFPGITHWFI